MNSNALAEVYQIIQYLPEKEYQRIPKTQIDYIEKNMNKDFPKICNITSNLENVKLSIEAKAFLLNLFYINIANEDQKLKLKNFIITEDKKKNEIINQKMFDNFTYTPKIQQTTSLTVIEKKSIFSKIKNFFFKIFKNK